MSETQANDGPRVEVRRIRQMNGFIPTCRQPSVTAVLFVGTEADPSSIAPRLYKVLGIAADLQRPVQSMAALLAEASLQLHNEAGVPQFWAYAGRRVDGPIWEITTPTVTGAHQQTASVLRQLAILITCVLRGEELKAALHALRLALRDLRREAPAGKNPFLMLETAHRLGIPWRRVAGNVYSLGQGRHTRWFNSTVTDRTSAIGTMLAKNKNTTAQVLRSRGLPVPDHQLATSEAAAIAIAGQLGYPVVIKPSNQDRGIGVHAMLRTPEQVATAWRDARQHSDSILVEKHFVGEDYRLYVFEGEMFRVRHRVPGSVTGDGRSTVRELLAIVNADPRRGQRGTFAEWIRIELDDEAMQLLIEQGLGADDVPASGQFVRLRKIANISVGGVPLPVDVADVHPDNAALAVDAVAALKLDLGAIDLLIPDIGKSWIETGAAICEVNAQPQWAAGAPEWLYAKLFAQQGRIPIVAVLSDTEPAWLERLRDRAQSAGVRLGICSASGAWRGAERISQAHAQGVFHSCGVLLEDTRTDAIVMFADPGLRRQGMPVDCIDALVLSARTDIPAEDRLGSVMSAFASQVLCDTDAPGWRPSKESLRSPVVIEATASDVGRRVESILGIA